MNQAILTDSNFLLYAARNYTNVHCDDMDEFYSDLFIPILIKKLISKYKNNNMLKERLIVNHIISFFNVFNAHAAVKLLFFKTPVDLHKELKTILVFLNRCPDIIDNLYPYPYILKNIENDEILLKKLYETFDEPQHNNLRKT